MNHSNDTAPRIIELIAKSKSLPPDSLSLASTFDELQIDSLDKINLTFDVEEMFVIQIADDSLNSLRTIGDVVDGVNRLLAENSSLCRLPPSNAPRRPVDLPRVAKDLLAARSVDLAYGETPQHMQRVVITGLGCLTAIGNSPAELWAALLAGRSGLDVYQPAEPDPTLKFKRLGQVAGPALENLTSTQIATSERCSQFALLSARQALADSGLRALYEPHRIGLIFGCSTNGRSAEEPETARLYTLNARVHPLTVPRSMASNGVSQVAIDQHITGPALTLSTACASGAHAIGLAFHMVRSGMLAAALCGAHEAPLTRGFLRAWDSMRVVSPTQCRPFSADRDGMSLAEGAAMLTLETLASARARHATIYAEVLGFGMSTDAHHMTQPRSEGPAQAIRTALADAADTLAGTDQPGSAQTLAEQIGYINAHGTATQANDITEAQAIHAVFGARARHIPVSSTKGAHGHSLGASSAVETLITALAIYHRRLPHTIGTTQVDPAIDLNILLNTPQTLPADQPVTALTNALAFGGLNSILCLRSIE